MSTDAVTTDTVAEFASRLWAWRDATAFRSADDIPRIPHDPEWLPCFDAASIAANVEALDAWQHEWAALDVSGHDVSVQVDHRLLGSTLARAHWEWSVLRSWETDANFLVSQIVGPYFDLLLPLPPFDAARQQGLVHAVETIPAQVAVARENLARAGVRDLAGVAVAALERIDERLAASVAALAPYVTEGIHSSLVTAAQTAGVSLVQFREWLETAGPSMAEPRVVGRDNFVWYLRRVALIAAEPEALVAAAEQEYRRATVWETIGRNRGVEVPPVFASLDEQLHQQRLGEYEIREFYENSELLTQSGFGHYFVHAMPDYVAPLHWFGVNDDLTDARRPGDDGVAYTPDPGPDLPYFYAANARDPRLGIIHEGTHYQQLVRAWAHENEVRRHYYDSVANEGIAFYNEELMLQAGLFDFAPHSQNVVHNFNRLRSLRVLVDITLATGAFTLDEAAATFVSRVPMDAATAHEETAMYVATPGLAMSYLVGKLQLMAMLADAIEQHGPGFSFRTFHDWVWKNGNLPFSLQRWELLGDRSEIDALDGYRGKVRL